MSIASGGCTPCECGVPGACASELVSSLGITLLFALIPAVLSKIALSFILKKRFPGATNVASILLGSMFVLPLVLRSFLPNTSSDPRTLFALVSIFLIFISFSLFDRLKKRTGLKSIFIEGVLITVFLFLIIGSFQFLTRNFTQQKSTFSSIDIPSQQKDDKNTPTVKPITRDEQVKQSVLQSLGIQQKSETIITQLKSKNYAGLETSLHPAQKFSLEFRDYGGVHFSVEEFKNVLQQQKLSEVSVYKRVDDYEIMADTFLDAVSNLLQGQYTTEVYLNNHHYVVEHTELSEYNQADLLYMIGGKTARFTFQKDDNSNWFLQEIGYFDPNFPGY
ncbi:MAG: hypothetical protein U0946_02260 [Patescibacteria group bacterium]|nr:hypothetical protein [Patescibacteria group bacterium]